MSSSQAYSSTTGVTITVGTWQKTDVSHSRPDSPDVIVSREEVKPKTDNYSLSSPSSLPPPYSTYNKEYFSSEELHSDGEPLTLARFMFQYGFFFFPFWLAGIYILFTPLKPTPQWELGKTEEEKAYLIKVLRETELKWARRCLLAFYALCVLTFFSVLIIKFCILRSL